MYPEDYDGDSSDYSRDYKNTDYKNKDYKNTDVDDYYISLNNCDPEDFTNYMVWETDMTDNLQ